jgi:beta-galactosidase
VNLEVGGVRLLWATASALTVLDADSATPILVLAAEAGIEPQLCLPEGTVLEGQATALGGNAYAVPSSSAGPMTLTGSAGALKILVLPPSLADQSWVLDTPRGRELVLSVEPVWVDVMGLLAGRSLGTPSVRRYSSGSGRFERVAAAAVVREPSRQDVPVEPVRAAAAVPASFGSLAGRAAAPGGDAVAELSAVYRLGLPTADVAAESGVTELEIAWAGDVARLLVDGRVVADRFWDGSAWVIEIGDAGIRPGSDVSLQVLPLPKDAKVGLPAAAQRRRDAPVGELLAVDGVQLICWTDWREDLG